MAISGKYGKVDIPGVGENEPVFVLRAQDTLAPTTIKMYRALAASHRSSITETLQREIDRFLQWGGSRKVPD